MIKKIGVALAALALALAGLAAPAQASVNPAYYYAGGQDTPASAKVAFYADTLIADPAVDTGDRSLMEMTVQNSGVGYTPQYRQAIIGLGWLKNSGGVPTLFAERFRNNVFGGTFTGAGDGWVDYAPNCVDLGTPLNAVPVTWTSCTPGGITSTRNDVGTTKNFQWIYDSTAPAKWWGYYNSQAIGYYPVSIWSTGTAPTYTFADGKFFQLYGEVYDDDTTASPCTDMGTGIFPSDTSGPARGRWVNGKYSANTGDYFSSTWSVATNPSWYTAAPTGAGVTRHGYIGGSGSC